MKEKLTSNKILKYGPRYQGIKIAISNDGLNFIKLDKFLTKYGGVPCLLTVNDGTVIAAFQYFDPKARWFTLIDGSMINANISMIAISKSLDDGGNWSSPSPINLQNFPESFKDNCPNCRPVDPTIVLLNDGKYRLYFTYPPPDTPNQRSKILSAISSDCINFIFEEGIRFEVESRNVFDSSIIRIGEKWHYFSPVSKFGPNFHAVSDDGLNFKREKDIIGEGLSFIGNACITDNGCRFYGTFPDGFIVSFFSRDGYNWALESGIRITGSDVEKDVGITRLKNGVYLMAYETKPLRFDPFEK